MRWTQISMGIFLHTAVPDVNHKLTSGETVFSLYALGPLRHMRHSGATELYTTVWSRKKLLPNNGNTITTLFLGGRELTLIYLSQFHEVVKLYRSEIFSKWRPIGQLFWKQVCDPNPNYSWISIMCDYNSPFQIVSGWRRALVILM